MRERLDSQQALGTEQRRHPKMAVNLRVGQVLVLQDGAGPAIVIRLVAKHGQGARVEIAAPLSVKITPPAT